MSVTIYVKSTCPYCTKAKELLKTLHIPFIEHDVTFDPDLYASVKLRSGMNTVPQVFVGERCLGGYSEINALHAQGQLLPLIKEHSH